MSKGIDLKQAKLKDLNTILQMPKEAFSDLYAKYQDTETSPATENSVGFITCFCYNNLVSWQQTGNRIFDSLYFIYNTNNRNTPC
jgi:hypothetical protein